MDVQQVAEDVLRYLKRHPDAADTVEGIARWWLGGRGYENDLTVVQQAMKALVRRALVERQLLPDGTEIYRAGRACGGRQHSDRRES